jgi:prepilin-type N-terminal cleavage/methylation domain-containing protein
LQSPCSHPLIRLWKIFKMSKNKTFSGFTLIEILVVIAFIALLSTITFQSFRALNDKEALDKDAHGILSLMLEARSLTLSSKNANQYGVHFESDKAVIFTGGVYDANASDNVVMDLNHGVRITDIDLQGGGNEVIFTRLTGNTSQYGTTTISLLADSSKTKSIVIFQSGLSEVR